MTVSPNSSSAPSNSCDMFRYGLVGIASLELRFAPLRSSDLFCVELKSITAHQTA